MREDLVELSLQVLEDPYKYAKELKSKTGKKVITHYPMHIPDEIIHAAGALPMVMWKGNEPLTLGFTHVASNHCGLCRSIIDDALKGKLSFIDGMVFYDVCNAERGVEFSVERHARPAYLQWIHLPVSNSPAGREYCIEILTGLQKSLEGFTGQKVTAEKLWESIKIYNENRRLLRKLYEIRRKKPGLLKAKEAVAVVFSSMLMPKQEHNQLLGELVKELEAKNAPPEKRVRVILSGHFCQVPRTDVLDLIDDFGAVVVDDDLFAGYRYFANDVEVGGDPIAALTDRYFKRYPPDPTMVDRDANWGEFLKDIVGRSKAQGVITLMVKFCPPHQENQPDTSRTLMTAKIPELMLQIEHEAVSLASLRTRLEAFIESLQN